MIETLDFILSSPWRFIGTLILIAWTAAGVAAIFGKAGPLVTFNRFERN